MSSSSSIGNCDRADTMLMKHISDAFSGQVCQRPFQNQDQHSSTFDHVNSLAAPKQWPGKSQAVDVGFVSTSVQHAVQSISDPFLNQTARTHVPQSQEFWSLFRTWRNVTNSFMPSALGAIGLSCRLWWTRVPVCEYALSATSLESAN